MTLPRAIKTRATSATAAALCSTGSKRPELTRFFLAGACERETGHTRTFDSCSLAPKKALCFASRGRRGQNMSPHLLQLDKTANGPYCCCKQAGALRQEPDSPP